MKPVVYVTRDIERALGKNPEAGYFIISNRTPYAESVQTQFPNSVWLIDSPEGNLLDTHELLIVPEVIKTITDHDASVIVFKNTSQIENICRDNNIKLLNPSAELAEKIENKTTQASWLGDLAHYLPQHSIIPVGDIVLENDSKGDIIPLIVQWAHSHTGEGTLLIKSEKELTALKEKFSKREARVTRYINGPVFTANIAIVPENTQQIIVGNISYQITGLPPFTDNQFSTIGNDWSLPHSILSEKEITLFETIAKEVGQKMVDAGWRGLFGIDTILDVETGTLHLLEINARQPASTTFESQLQNILALQDVKGVTMFDAHLAGLLAAPLTEPSNALLVNDGAQIIQRITSHISKQGTKLNTTLPQALKKLREQNYIVIEYANTAANSDFLRVQSFEGLIMGHNEPNTRGKEIINILETI